MTDECKHTNIVVEESTEKTYQRHEWCRQDEPREGEKIYWGDWTETQYHAQYCPSGESNCWEEINDEQITYESWCFECGKAIELEPMENYNWTLKKYEDRIDY